MSLDPLQRVSADVLALRILLGQLIVRIAAGSQDPAMVLKVMRDSAGKTADNAKLGGLTEAQLEELRTHVHGSIDRFFAAMRIEPKPAATTAPAAPIVKPAAPAKPNPPPKPAKPARAAATIPPIAAAPKAKPPQK